MTTDKTVEPQASDYAPYHYTLAFNAGYNDYMSGIISNPYTGVDAQAWDRGTEYAMRYSRWINH